MKIGLVRHFKVDIAKRPYMTSEEFNRYIFDYDRAGVIENEIVIDKEWDKCYCSSLGRAVTTAKTIYHGEIIPIDNLVEIPSAAWKNIKFRLPYHLWTILNRIAWIRNHVSQPEGRKKTLERVREIIEEILKEKDSNILIVSHAGTMFEIQKMLLRKGFKGNKFIKAKNGKLYIFEKR